MTRLLSLKTLVLIAGGWLGAAGLCATASGAEKPSPASGEAPLASDPAATVVPNGSVSTPAPSGAKKASTASGDSASASDSAVTVVHKAPFQGDLSLDGVFDAREMMEVAVRPEAWKEEFIIRQIAAPGAVVKGGDVLLKLETAHLEEAIADLDASTRADEIAIRKSEAELDSLEKSSPVDLEAARRAKQTADEDLKYFVETEREMGRKEAEFSLRSAKENLTYVEEELKQLEKMYRGDDLREDTEEIILTRQRNQVDAARFSLSEAQIERDHEIKTVLPRRDEDLHRAATKAALAVEKLEATTPAAIAAARADLDKQRMERSRNGLRLEKLRRDLKGMTIRAPHDGVVYYGENQQGKWATASSLAPRLGVGKSVQPFEILLTLVNPDEVNIRADVPEDDLHLLRSGLTGYAIPTGYPDERIPVRLAEAPPYPDVSGKFWARLTVDAGRLAKLGHRPVPGMTCNVKLTLFPRTEAISVPTKVLFRDDGEKAAWYVFVKGEGGKPARREVQIGRRTTDRVEITSGLKDGDALLQERPQGM